MIELIKEYFSRWKERSSKPKTIYTITCGEIDEHGFADAYIDGRKTNIRLFIWKKDDIEKLKEIQKQIYNKHNGNKN